MLTLIATMAAFGHLLYIYAPWRRKVLALGRAQSTNDEAPLSSAPSFD